MKTHGSARATGIVLALALCAGCQMLGGGYVNEVAWEKQSPLYLTVLEITREYEEEAGNTASLSMIDDLVGRIRSTEPPLSESDVALLKAEIAPWLDKLSTQVEADDSLEDRHRRAHRRAIEQARSWPSGGA